METSGRQKAGEPAFGQQKNQCPFRGNKATILQQKMPDHSIASSQSFFLFLNQYFKIQGSRNREILLVQITILNGKRKGLALLLTARAEYLNLILTAWSQWQGEHRTKGLGKVGDEQPKMAQPCQSSAGQQFEKLLIKGCHCFCLHFL